MNIFKIFGTIALEGKDKFNDDVDEATNKGGKLANTLGNGLKTAAKIGGAAVTAAATGLGVLIKNSTESYAEYEQLVGGTELLFGEAFDFIKDKAANAYSTVQMSQNEYLQQVNGFATGLKTALNGDAQAAAELADKIINAEADIVAATGNSQEAVQNAFNGIMKSNYTMLDNLQLGITPTKEGFQEVIDKVNEWNTANGKATAYQIDNLADCQAALVDYVDMQGLAGYAADEASKTIQGSLSSMKSAWQNLTVGIADENADIETLIGNFVNSAVTVAGNLIPRIEQILLGIGTLIANLAPVIGEALPNLISTVLPSLMSAGLALLMGIIDGILSNFDTLLDAVFLTIDMLLGGIIENLPRIVEMGIEILLKLALGIVQAIPDLVQKIPEIISAIVQGFTNALPQIKEVGKNIINSLWDGIKEIWNSVTSWASNALGALFGGNKVEVGVSGNVDGSHASGLNYVPFNGYIAELHKGEMVLPATEAQRMRNGQLAYAGAAQPITIPITLELDGAVLARKTYSYNQTEIARHGKSFVR